MGSRKWNHHGVVGVDLAASPKRSTGICALKKDEIVSCSVVHTDQEIFDYIEKASPALIAVDAPPALSQAAHSGLKVKMGISKQLRPLHHRLGKRRVLYGF